MGNGLAARATLVVVLAACANHPAAADHAAAWRDDLAFVARELPARHVKPFAHITEAAWRAQVAALDYPLQLTWFDDGIFVVGADAAHAGAIGKQLVCTRARPIS